MEWTIAAFRVRACALAAAVLVAGCAWLRGPRDPDVPEVVRVQLYDTRIDTTPVMVGRGKVTFDISNEGQLEHGLRIVGPGIDDQSDEFLVPGQHRSVTLKLGEGTYRIFCPDGNHADLGMWAKIEVTDSPGWARR